MRTYGIIYKDDSIVRVRCYEAATPGAALLAWEDQRTSLSMRPTADPIGWFEVKDNTSGGHVGSVVKRINPQPPVPVVGAYIVSDVWVTPWV